MSGRIEEFTIRCIPNHDLLWSPRDVTWSLPEVRFLFWPFNVSCWCFGESRRGNHDGVRSLPPPLDFLCCVQKLFAWNCFWKQDYFDFSWPTGNKLLTLAPFWRNGIERAAQELSGTRPPTYDRLWDNGRCPEKYHISLNLTLNGLWEAHYWPEWKKKFNYFRNYTLKAIEDFSTFFFPFIYLFIY